MPLPYNPSHFIMVLGRGPVELGYQSHGGGDDILPHRVQRLAAESVAGPAVRVVRLDGDCALQSASVGDSDGAHDDHIAHRRGSG